VAVLLATVALSFLASENTAATSAPTFNDDVAPILFEKCAGCHRPEQAAPMSLLSYADARPWAQAIKRKVMSREMPPWYADRRFGRFRNDPSLSASELRTIVAWVDGGAMEGSGTVPAPPPRASGWNHPSGRPPDVVLDMPMEVGIPAHGQLPPFAVYSELPGELAAADHFVEAVQLLPRNLSVVHHSALSMRALPSGVRLGSGPAWPGGPILDHLPLLIDPSPAGLTARRQASEAEAFSSVGTSHFVFFFPGNNGFVQFAPGVGKRIRHEDFVEWSVHYTPTGSEVTDRERAGLWFQTGQPTHEVVTIRIGDFHIVNGQEIVLPQGMWTTPGHAAVVSVQGRCAGVPCPEDRSMIPPIPAGAQNWKITAITPFEDDVTLYLAYPHGHLRLTDMTYVVTYPDGREETILSVPAFDFNWQLVYEWATPLKVPAGSTIKAIGHYDNSRANRRNPAPDEDVHWAEQSWDEMFNGYVDLSIDKMDLRREPMRLPFTATASASVKVPEVTTVGCVSRIDGEWMLTKAREPRVSNIPHADAAEIAAAERSPSGVARYRLIGTAEFASANELLSRGQRAAFTRAGSANVTDALQEGRKVFVKALLIPGTPAQTLNLLSVQPVAGTCR
jgi:hypothetical protein